MADDRKGPNPKLYRPPKPEPVHRRVEDSNVYSPPVVIVEPAPDKTCTSGSFRYKLCGLVYENIYLAVSQEDENDYKRELNMCMIVLPCTAEVDDSFWISMVPDRVCNPHLAPLICGISDKNQIRYFTSDYINIEKWVQKKHDEWISSRNESRNSSEAAKISWVKFIVPCLKNIVRGVMKGLWEFYERGLYHGNLWCHYTILVNKEDYAVLVPLRKMVTLGPEVQENYQKLLFLKGVQKDLTDLKSWMNRILGWSFPMCYPLTDLCITDMIPHDLSHIEMTINHVNRCKIFENPAAAVLFLTDFPSLWDNLNQCIHFVSTVSEGIKLGKLEEYYIEQAFRSFGVYDSWHSDVDNATIHYALYISRRGLPKNVSLPGYHQKHPVAFLRNFTWHYRQYEGEENKWTGPAKDHDQHYAMGEILKTWPDILIWVKHGLVQAFLSKQSEVLRRDQMWIIKNCWGTKLKSKSSLSQLRLLVFKDLIDQSSDVSTSLGSVDVEDLPLKPSNTETAELSKALEVSLSEVKNEQDSSSGTAPSSSGGSFENC